MLARCTARRGALSRLHASFAAGGPVSHSSLSWLDAFSERTQNHAQPESNSAKENAAYVLYLSKVRSHLWIAPLKTSPNASS